MNASRYGEVEQAGPQVRRVLARNPSPFTFTGTQSHIVGHGDVAIIDPGPDLPEHVGVLLAATKGERITAIFVTHTHRDHSPAAHLLRDACGAPVMGCAPLVPAVTDGFSEAFDVDYTPDRVLADGEAVEGEGWTLRALATPGHMSNHLCFAFEEERALFTGDHVMGWSTSVILPPDGSMAAYMKSLARLQARDDRIYYPAHGPAVEEPAKLVRGLIVHRRQREAQIVKAIAEVPSTVAGLVERLYVGLDLGLRAAAGASVLAHLIALADEGRAIEQDEMWRAA